MKNNKGFTMVELLAVIVILGVLSTIAIGGVSSVLSNAKKEYYSSQEDNLLLAAQSYGQNNRNVLPKGIGQMKKITLEELKNNNYLTEDLKSYSKKQCDMKNSYVQIFKYSQKDYSYLTFLDCSPEYTSKEKIKGMTPTIKEPSFSKDEKDLKNASVTVEIVGNEKVLGYSYILSYKSVKSGSKWREVKNSGSLNGNLKEKVSFTIKLKDYVPGTVRLEVSATNNYGQTASITASKTYDDKEGPDCIYLNEKDKYDEDDKDHYPWITQKGINRKMKVQCDDKNGIGCAKEEYTKTFKEDADMGIITIKDKLGNTTSCKMSVYIDRTAPSLTITAFKRSSSGDKTGKSVGSVTVNDSKRTASLNKYSNTVKDWLNKANYPNGIYYEISYKDGSRLHTRNWTQNTEGLKKDNPNVNTLNAKADEMIKGQNGTDARYLSAEGYRLGKYSVSDEAGNTVTINITAPIDRTEPKNLKVTNPSNGNWVRLPFSLTLEANDTMSGLNHFDYQYKNTNGSWNQYPNSNKSPFTTPKIADDMNQKIFIRVCDVAENCTSNSSAESTTIKLDGTPPTCKTTTNHDDWTNQNVTLTGTCSDATSGCVKTTITQDFKDEMNVGRSPGSVADQAGNVTTCPNKTVKIDKTKPDCTSSGGNSSWVNYGLTLVGTCTDTKGAVNSGCTGNAKNTKYNDGKSHYEDNQSPGTVYDKAGNSKACPANQTVHIDRDAPKCESSCGKTSWIKTGKTITGKCTETGTIKSGCVDTTVSGDYYKDTNKNVSPGTVKDKAGNKTTCDKCIVKVDVTKPTCNITATGTSKFTVKLNEKDDLSGVSDYGLGKNTSAKYNSKNTATQTASDGTVNWKGYVKDNAGNEGTCSKSLLVDTTPPDCPKITANVSSGTWTNKDVTFTFKFTSDTVKYDWYTRTSSRKNSNDFSWNDYGSWTLHTSGNSTSTKNKTIGTEGRKQGRLAVYDAAGNSKYCKTNDYWIDQTKPTINVPQLKTKSPSSIGCPNTVGSAVRAEVKDNLSGIDTNKTRYGSTKNLRPAMSDGWLAGKEGFCSDTGTVSAAWYICDKANNCINGSGSWKVK